MSEEIQESKVSIARISAISVSILVLLLAVSGWLLGESGLNRWPIPEIHEWGAYLSGVFAPLAFIWFLFSVHQQRLELKMQRKELSLLTKQLEQHKDVAQGELYFAKEAVLIKMFEDAYHSIDLSEERLSKIVRSTGMGNANSSWFIGNSKARTSYISIMQRSLRAILGCKEDTNLVNEPAQLWNHHLHNQFFSDEKQTIETITVVMGLTNVMLELEEVFRPVVHYAKVHKLEAPFQKYCDAYGLWDSVKYNFPIFLRVMSLHDRLIDLNEFDRLPETTAWGRSVHMFIQLVEEKPEIEVFWAPQCGKTFD